MAEQNSSPDWLPAGWTAKVKVRKNGRKDKCYIHPSLELKFHSKPEVLRYLSSVEINHPKSQEQINDSVKPKSQEKNKDSVKRFGKNIVVEKAVAEGLPPGWIKEVRVTKKGNSIRKDPYYTDPVSGYVFRSLKDIERYLKTGELGRLAFKPKDKGHINLELGDDKLPSHVVAQGQKLAGSGTTEQIIENQCSKLVEIVEDEEILSSTSTEDHIHLAKHDSDQRSDGAAVISINPQQTKSLEQREGKGDSNLRMSISAPVVGAFPEKLLENGVGSHGSIGIRRRINKSNGKRAADLPHRASKRLAGIKADPGSGAAMSSINPPQTKILEQREGKGDSNLPMSISAPVVGAFPEKLLENGVESHGSIGIQRKINKSNGKRAPDLPRRASKRLAGIEVDPALEVKTNNRTRRVVARRSGEAETSSSENFRDLATLEEHVGKVELETTDMEKQGLAIVLPIASLPISEEQAGEDEPLPISEEQAREEEPANKADVKPGSPLNLSLTDLWTDPCIEFAIKTLTGAIPVGEENNADENPGSSLDLPFGELWTDPCIEFAVKTLTGAIPVGGDLGFQNCFQQHVSSSDTQGVNGIMLPNVDNFCQTDYISQHFDAVEKPLNKQQAPVASKLLHTGNLSFQNSGDNGLHQHVEGRSSEELPKSTVL